MFVDYAKINDSDPLTEIYYYINQTFNLYIYLSKTFFLFIFIFQLLIGNKKRREKRKVTEPGVKTGWSLLMYMRI